MPVSLCKQCGYRWNHPQRIPKYCPSCKSTDWDIDPVEEGDSCEIAGCVCDLCGCKFFTGILQAHYCPNCGSKKWDSARKQASATGEGKSITDNHVKCRQCGHSWVPGSHRPKSEKIKIPSKCPKCRSSKWKMGE